VVKRSRWGWLLTVPSAMENLKEVPADQRHDYLTGLSRSELQRTAKEAGLKVHGCLVSRATTV
jgi:hypothetical protein